MVAGKGQRKAVKDYLCKGETLTSYEAFKIEGLFRTQNVRTVQSLPSSLPQESNGTTFTARLTVLFTPKVGRQNEGIMLPAVKC